MTTRQERKLSMELAVKDLLNQTANATIISSIPGFATYLTTFNSNVALMQTTRESQEINRTGLAVNKQELRDDLELKTLDVIRKVKAYAVGNGNSVLANEIGYTKSDLERSADTVLRDMCQIVYNKANANLTALNTYGVTAAILTALQTAITNYNASIPKPRLGITAKKQATEQLNNLFEATDSLLEKMDVLVEVIHMTQPAFYKNYIDARMLIDAGHTITPVRGFVRDKNSMLPISSVSVTVEDENIKVKTTVKGFFQMKHLQSGTYNFTFAKNGYATKTVVVNITNGERTEVEVELESL